MVIFFFLDPSNLCKEGLSQVLNSKSPAGSKRSTVAWITLAGVVEVKYGFQEYSVWKPVSVQNPQPAACWCQA